jgi:hypothetical protein
MDCGGVCASMDIRETSRYLRLAAGLILANNSPTVDADIRKNSAVAVPLRGGGLGNFAD